MNLEATVNMSQAQADEVVFSIGDVMEIINSPVPETTVINILVRKGKIKINIGMKEANNTGVGPTTAPSPVGVPPQ